jgi:hypothetical protein
MQFEALENAIKTRLQTDLGSAVEVEVEPQFEGENIQPYIRPRITIFLDQSEFDKTKTTHYIAQDENAKVFLLLRSRRLRGENGIYDLVERIRKSIVGFKPAHWDKIWLVKIAFDERFRAMWSYVMVIGSRSMIVEDEDQEATSPILLEPMAEYTDNQYN